MSFTDTLQASNSKERKLSRHQSLSLSFRRPSYFMIYVVHTICYVLSCCCMLFLSYLFYSRDPAYQYSIIQSYILVNNPYNVAVPIILLTTQLAVPHNYPFNPADFNVRILVGTVLPRTSSTNDQRSVF